MPAETRQCQNCKQDFIIEPEDLKEIKTSCSPDRPEIVYCESCYNAEVA